MSNKKIKKWLQLSDVHFGSPDSYNIETMREHFLKKCQELQGDIDYLFLTGDLRYSKTYPDKYPDGTVEFLQSVQKNLGVTPDNTFMVPGNHDIERIGGREKTIEEIKNLYQANRTIPDNYIKTLDLAREQYLELYEKICGIKRIEPHFCIQKDNLNIIHINSAILCSKDGEDGSLVIDMRALQKALNGIDNTKPSIAIAHHTFDCLEDKEQEQLELLLKQYNTVVFLCGHKHFTRCRNIHTMKPNINLWEYVCGTNMDNPSSSEPAEIGFFIGEIDIDSKSGYVEANRWSRRNHDWMPDAEFSFPKNGAFDGRYYFPSRKSTIDRRLGNQMIEQARLKYINYLEYECKIRMDGHSVNTEEQAKSFVLENLFVPLRFSALFDTQDRRKKSDDWLGFWDKTIEKIIPDKDIFRLAVFSGPGGGKTTWIKRLASAYGLNKRKEVDDALPERRLFPIWIKCRQFGDDTPLSILEIIRKIPERADFGVDTCLSQSFYEMMNEHIQNGTALVLIDGIDEIGNEVNRKAFINKLDRFAAMNEKVNIVMTSRIVGRDLITRNISVKFDYCKIQPFDQEDIKRLCGDWHKTVLGETKEAIEEAQRLSSVIIENERIYKLAQTPVLLTTLLLVSRRIGRLPTKRADLYREAIRVLLHSWGSNARLPMDLEEALPQLAYLAHYMTFHSTMRQTIGEAELVKVLSEARENLPQFFSNNSETVYKFIDRVEDRSALLMKRGLYEKDGEGSQSEMEYEFQHLTFQEYLAAYAVAHKYYPNAMRESRVTDCFDGIFEEDEIKEVILLTSVLTDRFGAEDMANALLKQLSDVRSKRHINRQTKISQIINLLMHMIADEAALTPNIRSKIYISCYDTMVFTGSIDGIEAVYLSKFSEELQNVLRQLDEKRQHKLFNPIFQLLELRKNHGFSVFTYYWENINTEKAMETLCIFDIATWLGSDWLGIVPEDMQSVKDSLISICFGEDRQLRKSAISTLHNLCGYDDPILSRQLLQKLLDLIDTWSYGMVLAYSFPITNDTILHIHGFYLSTLQKQDLDNRLEQENHIYNILGYFWFGVLLGAWNVNTIIQKAKDYYTSDYLNDDYKQRLLERTKCYLSILQESNAVAPEDEDLVNKYLDELEQEIQAKKKKDIFDW